MKKIKKLFFLFLFLQNTMLVAQLPDGFYDEIVVDNLDQYIGVVFDEAGSGYVWRRTGEVFLLDTNGELLPDPIIDISEEVASWWDMGMLGFALDPNFMENGKVYLLYVMDRHHLLFYGTPDYDPTITTKDEATIGRITRFTLDKINGFKTVVPGSRKVLLGATKETGFPLLFKTHGVGSLAFGTDGTLLATCGETGHPDWEDTGGCGGTYFAQAITDGIIRTEENVGAFRSQMVNSLSGKLIRIDPETGEGLPSNPFYDPAAPNSPRSKVWSLGLRNPYRFIVKPNSGSHFPGDGNPGEIFIGDVGSSFWEELNIATKGGQNFGWPIYEGFIERTGYTSKNIRNKDAINPLFGINGCDKEFFLFTDLINQPYLQSDYLFKNPCDTNYFIPSEINTFSHERPAIAYRNKNDNLFPEVIFPSYDNAGVPVALSISDPASGVTGAPFIGITSMGGCFYQGNAFPVEYQGIYFHPDYQGWVRTVDFDQNNKISKIDIFHSSSQNIISLSENPMDGCLYYMDFKNKKLRKICYGGSPAPVVVAEADKYYGASPLEVQLNASDSFSPANAPLSYRWDFGDGTVSDEIAPAHIFVSPENKPYLFKVLLTVSDTAGQSKSSEIIISLNNTPPQVEITSLPDTSFYSLDRTTLLQLNGAAYDAEQGEEELTFEWRTYLHHDDHEHTDLIEQEKESRFFLSPLGCHDEIYWYQVELKVTDAAGLSGSDTSYLFPYCENNLFELAYFTAEKNNRTVSLKWKTDFEKNISYFEIERGHTIFDFKAINKIKSNFNGDYSSIDFYPNIGVNFYRLKIWNDENIFSYTAPVMVDFSVEGDNILLYPNPAKDLILLSIKDVNSERIILKIFSMNGALVFKNNWPSIIGAYFNEQVLIPDLAQGIYFYEIENGENKKSGALIINH
ncbi:MAG: PQQ-dependent sugar dehydrogenase [Saprospiraceae bacterium]